MTPSAPKPQTSIRFRGTKDVWLTRTEGETRITLYDRMNQGQLQSHLKHGWEVNRKWTNV